jgi:hypothetical protein
VCRTTRGWDTVRYKMGLTSSIVSGRLFDGVAGEDFDREHQHHESETRDDGEAEAGHSCGVVHAPDVV